MTPEETRSGSSAEAAFERLWSDPSRTLREFQAGAAPDPAPSDSARLPRAWGPWPQRTRLLITGASVRGLLWLEAELAWFRGHFPDQPVLAGVVQVHWAAALAGLLAPAPDSGYPLRGLRQVKFLSPVLPGALLRIQVEGDPEQADFQCWTGAELSARGRLLKNP